MSRPQAAVTDCQRGVTLIEVLVALVIIAAGLLALIQLQTKSLRAASSAANRTHAMVTTVDILERMRINAAEVTSGAYAVSWTDFPSGTTLAARDVREWKAELADVLPEGEGRIVLNGNVATVSVRWAEPWDPDLADGYATVHVRSEL